MESIFISYRRTGTSGYGGRLQEDLQDHFGRERVFRDIDSIAPGTDFASVIELAVAQAGVVLALIGKTWLTATDRSGLRRLEDPKDFVRLELEAAIAQNVTVIPVLVEDAEPPAAGDLPPSLLPLAKFQAIELSDGRWDYDVGRLITRLEQLVDRPTVLVQRVTRISRSRALRVVSVVAAVAVMTAGAVAVATRSSGAGERKRTPPPTLVAPSSTAVPPAETTLVPTETTALPGPTVPPIPTPTVPPTSPRTAPTRPPVDTTPSPPTAPPTTAPPPLVTDNLVANPGAEDSGASPPFTAGSPPSGWQRGNLNAIAAAYGASGTRGGCSDAGYPTAGQLGGVGRQLFTGGYDAGGGCGLVTGDAPTLVQVISLASFGGRSDGAGWKAGALLAGYPGYGDGAQLVVEAIGGGGAVLGRWDTGPVTNGSGDFAFRTRTLSGTMPAGATSVRVTLIFPIESGGYSGGFADEVSFRFTG